MFGTKQCLMSHLILSGKIQGVNCRGLFPDTCPFPGSTEGPCSPENFLSRLQGFGAAFSNMSLMDPWLGRWPGWEFVPDSCERFVVTLWSLSPSPSLGLGLSRPPKRASKFAPPCSLALASHYWVRGLLLGSPLQRGRWSTASEQPHSPGNVLQGMLVQQALHHN